MNKILFACLLLPITLGYAGPPVVPTIVGPNTISTPMDEYGGTFTPDGKTCYFTIKSPSTISTSVMVICESHFDNGKWSAPTIAPFSGRYKDFSPSISPDGNKLFFVSNRPVNDKPSLDLWMVERKDNLWSDPVNVGEPVNATAAWEFGCSMTSDGTLFFSSTGNSGNFDIYYSKFVDGKFEAPVRLDDAVNSEASETDPFVAPDGSYLLFASSGRSDAVLEPGGGYPRGDLYVSFFKDGKWLTAKNLGSRVNSIAEESSPSVSRDGSKLYFASERNFISIPVNPKLNYKTLGQSLNDVSNGLGNIYEMDASILNELK